jgi:hypothetical protein
MPGSGTGPRPGGWEALLYTVHTACFPDPQDTSQHIKCWKPYAVIYGLALLKMGIMMPEARRANGLLINHNLLYQVGLTLHFILTLILLTWRIWWAPNNASRWQMGFNSALRGLKMYGHTNVKYYLLLTKAMCSLKWKGLMLCKSR